MIFINPKHFFGALFCWTIISSVNAEIVNRPLIQIYQRNQIASLCAYKLRALGKTQIAFEQNSDRNPHTLLRDWNDLQIELEDFQGPLEILNNVAPDPLLRASAETCLLALNQFNTSLFQSEKLYKRFSQFKPSDAIERKLQRDTLDSFEDTGVALPAVQRVRLKTIFDRIEQLAQEFTRNIRDNNQKVRFSEAEVKGLPAEYLARAPRDADGNYLLGFSYPEYNPFMESADDSAARRRYQTAFVNRGGPKNLELLAEVVNLRREIATLFGMPSYADFALRRRMALTSNAVLKFLSSVQQEIAPIEIKELEQLGKFKAQTLGTELAATNIERWDLAYWQQKFKQTHYQIDQNALRQYFPTEAALQWTLHLAGILYGVDFKAVEVPVWQQDVRYLDVIERATGQRIGGIYLDLFPRAGKYGHAAAFGIRGASSIAQRTPISVLVSNFDRVGLDADELETLVHEFGHVLHGVLSRTRYLTHAGTSVERDFVEAPSQMFEEWARSQQPLALLSKFCQTPCPTVDDDLLKRLTAAHNFGRALRYGRQLVYASYDMQLHSAQTAAPLPLWEQMESASLLGHVPGTEFPGQFGHLIGGYAAGYYGYMWSEVLALDMLSAFHGNLLNPVVGQRYRQTILARGGERRGGELVRDFLGRAPDNAAFFAEVTGRRLGK